MERPAAGTGLTGMDRADDKPRSSISPKIKEKSAEEVAAYHLTKRSRLRLTARGVVIKTKLKMLSHWINLRVGRKIPPA